MNTYCAKCKRDTGNLNSKNFRKKSNRLICNENVLFGELKSQDL